MADSQSKSSFRRPEPIGSSVGERLQRVRERFGLSQRELARQAKITNSTLSMIEQGKSSPSISSLEKILQAVPLSLPEFFSADYDCGRSVFTPDTWIQNDRGGTYGDVYGESLMFTTANLSGLLFSELRIAPSNTWDAVELYGDEASIGGKLLNGDLLCHHHNEIITLRAGDGFQFLCKNKPAFENQQQEEAKIILVVSYQHQ